MLFGADITTEKLYTDNKIYKRILISFGVMFYENNETRKILFEYINLKVYTGYVCK